MAEDKKRVLIIEDERPLAHALELKLGFEGMEAVAVNNGQEGLDQLKSSRFDVVLLDMMMPVMDGFEVLRRISEIGYKPVVFALSNLSVQDDQDKVLKQGADKYFIKSNTPLATIVEEIKKA